MQNLEKKNEKVLEANGCDDKLQQEIDNYRKAETYTLEETRTIINALLENGIIGEETVKEHMAKDDLLTDVELRPGFASVTFKQAK